MGVTPFNPAAAPVARNSDADVAQMRWELNAVILWLGEAGVPFHGRFKWRMAGEPY